MRPPIRTMVIAGVCFLLGIGLCAAGLIFGDVNQGSPTSPLINFGLAAFYIGALLLVIGFVWMLVDNTRGSRRGQQ
jgi:hypothetical protein